MLNVKQAALAILVAAAIGVYPQFSVAETFKSSEFLKWPRDSQASYIRTSVGMAAVIASQINGTRAKCLSDWYFGNPRAQQDAIRNAMAKNPSFHPHLVILAVLKKACGKIGS